MILCKVSDKNKSLEGRPNRGPHEPDSVSSCGVPQGSFLGPIIFTHDMLPFRSTIKKFKGISFILILRSSNLVQNATAPILSVPYRFGHITPILLSFQWLPVHFQIQSKKQQHFQSPQGSGSSILGG